MNFTIFIIDDDDDDQQIFRMAISQIGASIECKTCSEATKALKQLSHSDILPDLILLDMNMPQMSGLECLQELKSTIETSGIPVVAFDGVHNERNCKEAERLGALHYYTKPIHFSDVRRIIKGVLEESFHGHYPVC